MSGGSMGVEKKYRFIYELLTNNYSRPVKTNSYGFILIAYCNPIIFKAIHHTSKKYA